MYSSFLILKILEQFSKNASLFTNAYANVVFASLVERLRD